MTRASLDKQPHEVASMFDNVAERYDLTNDVLSLGQDRRWRKEVARAVDARPAQKVLDLAAGTATSSLPFARTGAYVVPCDFSLGMLQVGKTRQPWLPFTAGDATRLPFKDDTFDAVSISFGLRNVQDFDAALREMHRVTRPGGRVVICEFSHPTWAPFRTVYTEYLMRALPPSPARSPPTPTRTSTSPSPSAPGPTSPPWPSACAGPAGRGWRGGTSRAGSWPCTGASRRAETGPVGPVSADDRLEGVPRPVQFAFQPAPARSRHARFAHARPAAALPSPKSNHTVTTAPRGIPVPGGGYCRTTWSTTVRPNSGRSGAASSTPYARAVSRASTAMRPTSLGTRTSGVLGGMSTDVTPSGTGRVTARRAARKRQVAFCDSRLRCVTVGGGEIQPVAVALPL